MARIGFIGLGMEHCRLPLAPFVIGFILAPVAESNLVAGLQSHDGSLLPLFTQPFSAICLIIAAVLLFMPIYRRLGGLR